MPGAAVMLLLLLLLPFSHILYQHHLEEMAKTLDNWVSVHVQNIVNSFFQEADEDGSKALEKEALKEVPRVADNIVEYVVVVLTINERLVVKDVIREVPNIVRNEVFKETPDDNFVEKEVFKELLVEKMAAHELPREVAFEKPVERKWSR